MVVVICYDGFPTYTQALGFQTQDAHLQTNGGSGTWAKSIFLADGYIVSESQVPEFMWGNPLFSFFI